MGKYPFWPFHRASSYQFSRLSFFFFFFFIKKDLGLCGPNNVDWIKRVLGPIYLHLLKPFCHKTIFCSKAVFCGRFAFCCRSLFLAFLSLNLSCSLIFLVGLWTLLFHWAFLRVSFWVQIQKKRASTNVY